MNKPKTKLPKSKSSNSNINKKPHSRSDKSGSHLEFKPLVKKRGIYVEKKLTELSLNELVNNTPKRKRAPRSTKNRLPTSVLKKLTKSTTGTQCPEKKSIRNKKLSNDNNVITDIVFTKKQTKYKSKILNANKNFEDQFLILQTKKDINDTSSNYSETSRERDNIKWSEFLPPLVPKNDSNITVINTRKIKNTCKQKRVTLIDKDSPTVINNNDTITLIGNEKKKDDKLYNFFVDLLETTFNEYNHKHELNVPASLKSSKAVFKINESATKKLNIEKPKIIENFKGTDYKLSNFDGVPFEYKNNDSICIKPSSYNYYVQDAILGNINKKFKRKLKTKSFELKNKTPIPMIYSELSSFKKPLKRNRKRNFLNILREELKTNNINYEEPRNFFQSLKVMARNKRRHQKSIGFNESTKQTKDDNKDCIFKRRRLLSNSLTSKSKKIMNQRSENKDLIKYTYNTKNTIYNPKKIVPESKAESSHSIKVYGFEYKTPNFNNIYDLGEY